MKTIRRDWLRKQVEAGTMLAKCDFHLTDDYLLDVANQFGTTGWLPVRIRTPRFETYVNEHGYERERCVDDDFKQGFLNLLACDFTFKSGSAWQEEHSVLINLNVHSNLSYTLCRKDAGKKERPIPQLTVKPRIRVMAIARQID